MSDERSDSQSVSFWVFCLLAAPVAVIVLVLGSVFIENKTTRTHHIESTLTNWHIDMPFRWAAGVTGLGPGTNRARQVRRSSSANPAP